MQEVQRFSKNVIADKIAEVAYIVLICLLLGSVCLDYVEEIIKLFPYIGGWASVVMDLLMASAVIISLPYVAKKLVLFDLLFYFIFIFVYVVGLIIRKSEFGLLWSRFGGLFFKVVPLYQANVCTFCALNAES